MSNISCEVIKDLMPLYVDDVCSEQSKNLVEEHLASCENCQDMYHAMQEKLPEVIIPGEENGKKEAESSFIKDIEHKITFGRMLTVGVAILLILAGFMLNPVLSKYADLRKIPFFDSRISVDEVEVTDLYRLKDGRIFYTLNFKKGVTALTVPKVEVPGKNGQLNTPIEGYTYEEAWIGIEASNSIWERIESSFNSSKPVYNSSFTTAFPGTLDIVTENQDIAGPGKTTIKEFTAVCFEGKGGRRKMIWEKGDSIPDAPQSIEKKVSEQEKMNPNYSEDDVLSSSIIIF